jgi:transcriptional regulator of arginine metabolism
MKDNRHSKIIQLINLYSIETQEELADRLRAEGFEITQATISRDIKELRLTKALDETGKYKYYSIGSLDNATTPEVNISEKLNTIFTESVIGLDYALNLIVVKTLSGMAQAAATTIDAMNIKGVLGSIAGDDTIMVVTKSVDKALELTKMFKNMLK